ncbi:MAG: RHS repeat-associated core domain-containing protein [Planctomycetes bacterium]|nr:RHS repeat-associated core domain-containing protein [Planctomycetota bacterium]
MKQSKLLGIALSIIVLIGVVSSFVFARQYDPRTGRFNRRDPIEYDGGVNLYTYVENNPVNYTDPYGKWKFEVKGEQVVAISTKGDVNSLMMLAILLNKSLTPEDMARDSLNAEYEIGSEIVVCCDVCSLLPKMKEMSEWLSYMKGLYQKMDALGADEKPKTADDVDKKIDEWVKKGKNIDAAKAGTSRTEGSVRLGEVYVQPYDNPLIVQMQREHEEYHLRPNWDFIIEVVKKTGAKKAELDNPTFLRDYHIMDEIETYETSIKYTNELINKIEDICLKKNK